MVAAKQFSNRLELSQNLVGVSIAYDGKPRVDHQSHQDEIDASYQRGYNEASSQFNQQIVEFRTEVNALREKTFSDIESKFSTLTKEAREALMTLTYDCVCRVLGGFEMTGEAVQSVVSSVVEESGLSDEQMEAHLHPADIALLKDLEEGLEAKHPSLSFVPDESLSRGDCILCSRFGKVDGLLSTKLDRLKESMNPEE